MDLLSPARRQFDWQNFLKHQIRGHDALEFVDSQIDRIHFSLAVGLHHLSGDFARLFNFRLFNNTNVLAADVKFAFAEVVARLCGLMVSTRRSALPMIVGKFLRNHAKSGSS